MSCTILVGAHCMFTYSSSRAFPRLDGNNEDDSEDDREDGCGQVVDDGSESDLAREGQVHGPHGRDQRGDDQGDDDAFQHVQEQLSDESDIELDFSSGPGFLCLLQTYSKTNS